MPGTRRPVSSSRAWVKVARRAAHGAFQIVKFPLLLKIVHRPFPRKKGAERATSLFLSRKIPARYLIWRFAERCALRCSGVSQLSATSSEAGSRFNSASGRATSCRARSSTSRAARFLRRAARSFPLCSLFIHQKVFRLSSKRVTGPELTRLTSICRLKSAGRHRQSAATEQVDKHS